MIFSLRSTTIRIKPTATITLPVRTYVYRKVNDTPHDRQAGQMLRNEPKDGPESSHLPSSPSQCMWIFLKGVEKNPARVKPGSI